ncbi:MAG: mdtK [Gammaproteobacteria bacterium]|nr:mdtK [Gammaproteobacteria bacterium]
MAHPKIIVINEDESEQTLEPVTRGSSFQDDDFNKLIERVKSADPTLSVSFWDIFKHISKVGIPMSLSFTFCFEVFSSVLLLQLISQSEDDTAAATLVSTIMNTFCIIAMSPLLSVMNVLSSKLEEWKEKQLTDSQALIALADEPDLKEQIESVGPYAFLMVAAVSVPCWASLYFSRAIMTTIFHQQDSVARSAERFLRPYSFAVPALMARVALGVIMLSFGKNKESMGLALVTFVMGLGLAILLGFGYKFFPDLDQTGIALGFVLETYLTALCYGLFVKFNKECREFNFFQISWNILRRNTDVLKDMLRYGMAFVVSYSIDLSLTLAIGILSGLLGVEQQSAMSYCLQFIFFEFIFLAAFSMTCMGEVTRAMSVKNSQQDPDQIYQMARFSVQLSRGGLITSLIYLTPFPLFLAVYPKALEFISGGASPEVSKQLRTLVPIMVVGALFDNIRYNLLQQSRAFEDLSLPIVIAFCGMVSGIALAALFGFAANLGIDGVAMGYAIGLGGAAAALFLRWWSQCNTLIAEADPERQPVITAHSIPESSCIRSIFSFFGRSPQSVPPSDSLNLNRANRLPEQGVEYLEDPYSNVALESRFA